jgi:hypothetical protein
MNKIKKLLDAYAFPGFRPLAIVKGKFGDNKARIVQLIRRQKKLYAVFAERFIKASMTGRSNWSGICPAATSGSICQWKRGGSTV